MIYTEQLNSTFATQALHSDIWFIQWESQTIRHYLEVPTMKTTKYIQ